MSSPDSRPGALEGLRVIELANERSAWAGKLIADMGADVITIEPPGGSVMRTYPPFLDDEPGVERSLYWWHYNTSKRGITLDIEAEEGQSVFRKLVAGADMLIEAEHPGHLEFLGIDYPDLAPANPGLIMVSITPFGRSGPRADEPANDLTILAGGGPGWMNGYDDHSLPPVRGGGNQGYHTGSHYGVMAALTALLYRDVSGQGQHIDVNMHAAANVTTEAGSYTWLVAEQEVQRQTGRHAGVNPSMESQVMCADGRYVNTGVPPRRPAHFRAMYEWIEDLGGLEEFPEAELLLLGAKMERIDLSKIATDPEIAMIFGAGRDSVNYIASRLSAYEFFTGGQQRGMQVGIIYSPEEAMEDPHFKARGFPVPVEHPEHGRSFTYPGAPYLMHASPWRISRRAPLLGEHTDEVLGELGYGSDAITAFHTAEVV